MKYFLHDTSAFSDEKITMLYIKFGYEGVGLFYTILERLALQEKPIQENVLKVQLNIKKRLEKQLHFMYEIDLLSVTNGEVFNENLLTFSGKYQIKKEKTRKRVSEWREKQKDTKNVTRYKHVRNADKVKESKVNESNKKKTYKDYPLSSLKNEDVENKDYLQSTLLFYDLFKSNLVELGINTSKLEKAKGNWIDPIRLILEVDEYNKQDLRTVYDFLKRDNFWKENIRSTSKLRDKFETLLIRAKGNNGNTYNNYNNHTVQHHDSDFGA